MDCRFCDVVALSQERWRGMMHGMVLLLLLLSSSLLSFLLLHGRQKAQARDMARTADGRRAGCESKRTRSTVPPLLPLSHLPSAVRLVPRLRPSNSRQGSTTRLGAEAGAGAAGRHSAERPAVVSWDLHHSAARCPCFFVFLFQISFFFPGLGFRIWAGILRYAWTG